MRVQLMLTALLTATVFAGIVDKVHADGVDDYLKAQMAAHHIPGLSVAVVQDGKVVKRQGYGVSNIETKTPATADTVYQIASLTKQFTAAAILTLVQQNKLRPDDLISKYIAGLPAAWKAITVRELLNQTSGLPNYRKSIDYEGGGASKDYSAAEVIALAAAKPLEFAPGTRFGYSNTNYHLLGMIVEKVSGQSYGDYLQQTFFGPLNMTQTKMVRPDKTAPNAALGTIWDGTTLHVSPIVFSPTINFGDDGICSTVPDLVKWNAALDGNILLTPASKLLLWTAPTLQGDAPQSYGSGWFVGQVKSHPLLWHNGLSVSGFTGAIFRFPSDKLTLIVLTNSLGIPEMSTGYPLYSLTLGLARLYLPDLAKPDAGIPDADPETAALVKTLSAQFASGTLDKSLFEPAIAARLTPPVVGSVHDVLAPLGPLTTLTLLDRSPNRVAHYQAFYGPNIVDWRISVDEAHKIKSLMAVPE